MFLRRVTIVGFKSFANKTVLDLEPGITGVVGPNGSGKSNLADAVRWALGEQSKGRLRLSDREEVVFAGTQKRAKASFAEVTLLFDNHDGAFPLDLTEVEITRRLYRSGEADYRLAGRSVRLSDIQGLLVQAGFGANTYAVIGQGMIDSLLLASPAERKLLFDDAAGIRGPEQSREASLRKLAATEANLTRLRDIATELSPRLASLERTVTSDAAHRQLQRRVADLRAAVVGARLHRAQAERAAAETSAHEAATTLLRLRHSQVQIERQLQAARDHDARLATKRDQLQQSLRALELQRDELGAELAEARSAVAAAELGAGQLPALQRQLAEADAAACDAAAREAELEAELASNAAAAARATKALERANRDVTAAQAALVTLRQTASDGTRDQYVDHALQVIKTIAIGIGSDDITLEQIRLLVHKAGRLLSHATRDNAAQLLGDIKSAQQQLETAMAKREIAVEHQTNITITARSLEIDLAHQRDATTRARAAAANITTALVPARAHAEALPALQARTTHVAAAMTKATRQLETARAAMQQLGSTAGDLQTQARLIAELEQTKAAATAVEAEQARLADRLAELTTARDAAIAQAKHWQLTPTPAASSQSPAELESQLLHAEAQYDAQTAAQAQHQLEYQNVSTRAQELSTQIGDLEAAYADLSRIVGELDELIKTRFKTNFAALAGQFSHYFSRLFDGGTATLELLDTEGSGYGISIKASPKGKRPVSIAALSGGERSLAGVALLAAILRVNPSPFVVLDEIDAALDEANSGRLAAILTELAKSSQLIIITHNRQTMQAARVLFGITVGEHHVSHLLSMRLEEAAKLAAR